MPTRAKLFTQTTTIISKPDEIMEPPLRASRKAVESWLETASTQAPFFEKAALYEFTKHGFNYHALTPSEARGIYNALFATPVYAALAGLALPFFDEAIRSLRSFKMPYRDVEEDEPHETMTFVKTCVEKTLNKDDSSASVVHVGVFGSIRSCRPLAVNTERELEEVRFANLAGQIYRRAELLCINMVEQLAAEASLHADDDRALSMLARVISMQSSMMEALKTSLWELCCALSDDLIRRWRGRVLEAVTSSPLTAQVTLTLRFDPTDPRNEAPIFSIQDDLQMNWAENAHGLRLESVTGS